MPALRARITLDEDRPALLLEAGVWAQTDLPRRRVDASSCSPTVPTTPSEYIHGEPSAAAVRHEPASGRGAGGRHHGQRRCASTWLAVGFDVTVFDREHAPMSAASRWNEGKIHLGYIYGADPTLATAQHLLTGGLQFEDRLRELVDGELAGHSTTEDDLYLVHADSVVGPDHLRADSRRSASSSESIPTPAATSWTSPTLAPSSSTGRLAGLAGPDIVAGFRVPERSVETRWVADRLAGAVAAQPRRDAASRHRAWWGCGRSNGMDRGA